MFCPHCFKLQVVLLLVAFGLPSLAEQPVDEGRPPQRFTSRAELEREYDRDGDGRLNREELQAMVDEILAGRVEVPPRFRERVLRLQERLRDGAQRPADRVLGDRVIVQRDIVYGDGGGRPLKLDLVLPQPEPEKPLPLIVFIHGGGWRGGDKAGGVGRVAPLVATGNYVGATVGYRLSGEATWPAQIHDCKAALRWLRANAQRYHIDPDRIGVWGSSAGGHLVNMLGTSGDFEALEGAGGSPGHSTRVRCVVPFCGPTNFLAPQLLESGRRPSAVDLLLGGPIEERRELAREASPITYVSADDPPFLLLHGTADPIVPFEQAEMFHDALKEAGVDVTLVRIVGGSHAVGGDEVMRRVAAFFEKHLRDRDVAVSAEPIQAPQRRDE